MSSDSQESSCAYEENEVVWAKINGYPWWPAYISLINQDDPQEFLYTVIFFGDNSHSQLNFQKIRKFEPYFRQYALASKKNYKLKLALMSAHDQLRENKQDTAYFESITINKKTKKQQPDDTLKQKQDKQALNEPEKPEHQQKKQSDSLNYEHKPSSQKKIDGIESNRSTEHDPLKSHEVIQPKLHEVTSTKKVQDLQRPLQGQQPSEQYKYNGIELKQVQFEIHLQYSESVQQNLANRLQEQIKQLVEEKEAEQIVRVTRREGSCIKRPESKVEKIVELLRKNNKKDALLQLGRIRITKQNIIDILDTGIVKAIDEQTNESKKNKLKQRLKRILQQKYFKQVKQVPFVERETQITLQTRKRVLKQLVKELKRNNIRDYAQIAQKYENELIKEENPEKYMRRIIQFLKNNGASQIVNNEKQKLVDT